MNAKYVLLLALGMGAMLSQAHETPATPKALAARYTLNSHKLKTDWYLWRDTDRIETATLASGQNVIWERQGPHSFRQRVVFADEGRIVDYSPGEIRTRHAEPDWSQLGSVISPKLLGALRRGASRLQFGQQSTHYSGHVQGQEIALWWLNDSQLPAQLAIRGRGRAFTLRLREIHAVSPVAWPRTSEEKLADYTLIDAADFGDMESDPFVARLLAREGHPHAH
nr:hypothetical protein [Dechloromonas sp.]